MHGGRGPLARTVVSSAIESEKKKLGALAAKTRSKSGTTRVASRRLNLERKEQARDDISTRCFHEKNSPSKFLNSHAWRSLSLSGWRNARGFSRCIQLVPGSW